MNSDYESDEMSITPDLSEVVNVTSLSLLPERSAKRYEHAYKGFMDWQRERGTNSFSEDVLLDYFKELGKKYKPSLWVYYSMLRSTISINNNIDITTYGKLRAFIKQHNIGYEPKKPKSFTSFEINTFIEQAPDEKYLATKVALIMGIVGALQAQELYAIKFKDVEDFQTALIISVPAVYNKTKSIRTFAITGRFYDICKKYISLRPMHTSVSPAFFLNYQNGKCSVQNFGINQFGRMVKEIAKFLKLPNPEMYNGHCFKKSAESVPVQSDLVKKEDWKSLDETYFDAPFMIDEEQDNSLSFNEPNAEIKLENDFDHCTNGNDPLETRSFISDELNSDIAADAFDNVNSKGIYKSILHNLEQKIKLKQLKLIQKTIEQKEKLFEIELRKRRCEEQECENKRKVSELELEIKQRELEHKRNLFDLELKKMSTS